MWAENAVSLDGTARADAPCLGGHMVVAWTEPIVTARAYTAVATLDAHFMENRARDAETDADAARAYSATPRAAAETCEHASQFRERRWQ
jgi:hypothetical protein